MGAVGVVGADVTGGVRGEPRWSVGGHRAAATWSMASLRWLEGDGLGRSAVVLEPGRVEACRRVGEIVVGRSEAAGAVVVEVVSEVGEGDDRIAVSRPVLLATMVAPTLTVPSL